MSTEIAGVPVRAWLPSRAAIIDSLLLGCVATLLVAIHYLLRPSIHVLLEFDHQAVNLWGLLTAAYVHHNTQHLFGNVATFLIAGSLASGLYRMADQRRLFHLLLGPLLVMLPVMVLATSFVVVSIVAPEAAPTERGFSGVASGVIGVALAALFGLVARWYSPRSAWRLGVGTFIMLEATVGLIYSGGQSFKVLGLAFLGASLIGWDLARITEWPTSREAWIDWGVHAGFVGLVVVMLVLFMLVMFPAQVVTDGSTINIVAHGVGFLYGIGFALVGWFLVRGEPTSSS
ncbi:rhomboid family intramembrane serine protease [Halorientalis regularis]|uniref:Rhomboid family protein n=1 Tax=Halorientalis regularis TaxID=660518 RepID=A0A1G7U7C6_9EURY|nr:rhomboid family intramembrane serine protease [Halorientalis regularis]SDG42660.1 Rhomboid family protein [Halorientalis regularis]